MKQTFDLDTMLFNLLKGSPEVVSEISGDVYSLGERPDDSQDEDIVVNSIYLTQEYLPQLGTSNVNIHVSDMEVQIKKKKQKKANRKRLKAISTIVLKTLKAAKFDGLAMVVTNQTVLNEPSLSQHYVNIRIDWIIH